jgi:hypothetical protein
MCSSEQQYEHNSGQQCKHNSEQQRSLLKGESGAAGSKPLLTRVEQLVELAAREGK